MSTCERILVPPFLSLSIMMENKVEEKELEMVAEATDRGSQCTTERKGGPEPHPMGGLAPGSPEGGREAVS